MDVSDDGTSLRLPLTMEQRGEHTIDDELVFSNHTGYVFHDSRGIESGSTEELEILREFIRRKCGERRLPDRLHAIWFGLSSVYNHDNWRPHFEVLRPNGQPTARAWPEILQGRLPGPEWCVITNIHDCI